MEQVTLEDVRGVVLNAVKRANGNSADEMTIEWLIRQWRNFNPKWYKALKMLGLLEKAAGAKAYFHEQAIQEIKGMYPSASMSELEELVPQSLLMIEEDEWTAEIPVTIQRDWLGNPIWEDEEE